MKSQGSPIGHEVRRERHVALYESICELERILPKTRLLVNKLREGETPQTTNEKQPQQPSPPFLEVMDNSPNRIGDIAGEMKELLSQIEELIF